MTCLKPPCNFTRPVRSLLSVSAARWWRMSGGMQAPLPSCAAAGVVSFTRIVSSAWPLPVASWGAKAAGPGAPGLAACKAGLTAQTPLGRLR